MRAYNFIDLTGQRFSRLLVIGDYKYNTKGRWLCRCDCGNVKYVPAINLRSGKTKSCGCYAKEVTIKHSTTHGMFGKPIYHIWNAMLQRCNNPKSSGYHKYGARGIKVCNRWLKFENFYTDMGNRPSKYHSIHRINNNSNYEPDNCKWATSHEQANNRRNNRLFTLKLNGRESTKSVSDWSRLYNLKPSTVFRRLDLGYPIEEALALPVGFRNLHDG